MGFEMQLQVTYEQFLLTYRKGHDQNFVAIPGNMDRNAHTAMLQQTDEGPYNFREKTSVLISTET